MTIVPRVLCGLLAAFEALSLPAKAELVAQFQGDRLAVYADASGHWQRSDLGSIFREHPDWQLLLDVAALGRAEGHAWSLKGADCLPPDYRRCLLFLGQPGTSDVALREYDTDAHQFVPGGFALPPGPTRAAWYDDARIMIVADGGPGTVTGKGIPRLVRLWRRGEPLFNAATIYAGPMDVAAIKPVFSLSPGGLFHAAIILTGDGRKSIYHFGWAQNFRSPPLPQDFEFLDFFQGNAMVLLRQSWVVGRERFPAGSIVAYPMAALMGARGELAVERAYSPPAGYGVVSARSGRDEFFVAIRGAGGDRLVSVRKGAPDWPVRDISLPGNGVMSLIAASNLADAALIERTDTAKSSYFIVGRGAARELKP